KELPGDGVTLLSGVSGAGKSTIFNAILFALYGVAKRPYTHGMTTCSVTLEYKRFGLTITRSSNPNNLKVVSLGVDENGNSTTTTYEDEPAQQFINNTLKMNNDQFQISSYFDQKRH